MKKLILVRHAKSSWEAITNDVTRPISQRGVLDAHLVSAELQKYLSKSFIVWSSKAKRAKETATIFCQNMDINLDCILIKDDLYTFEYSKLTNEIKKCKNEYDSLILFGHNDAITKFVNNFGNQCFDNIPTSGVVIINFPQQEWSNISSGVIEHTIFPRDLKVINEY